MSIGSVIKQLRHERDMTQEQLAELLNVSIAAISAWECDRNYPDISQLPMLSQIFGVSSDHLLGIDLSLQDEKIEKIIEDAEKLSGRDKVDAYRLALSEFPASYRLMSFLAASLNYSGEPGTSSRRLREAIALHERICRDSKDQSLKNKSQYRLCRIYLSQGKRDDALRISESVPFLMYSHKDFELLLAQGRDKIYEMHYNIKSSFSSLCNDICLFAKTYVDGKPFFTHEQAITLLEKIPGLYKLLYEDGDYFEDGVAVALAFVGMAEHYAELKDEANTILCIKNAVEYAKGADEYYDGLETGPYGISGAWEYDQIPKDKRHTSVLADPALDYPTTTLWIDKTEDSSIIQVSRELSHQRFDFVREEVNRLMEL